MLDHFSDSEGTLYQAWTTGDEGRGVWSHLVKLVGSSREVVSTEKHKTEAEGRIFLEDLAENKMGLKWKNITLEEVAEYNRKRVASC